MGVFFGLLYICTYIGTLRPKLQRLNTNLTFDDKITELRGSKMINLRSSNKCGFVAQSVPK
jgi:hypothetical protein